MVRYAGIYPDKHAKTQRKIERQEDEVGPDRKTRRQRASQTDTHRDS